MRYIIITLFVIAILFLQIGIFPNLKIANAYPNIILLALISLAILTGWKKSLGWIIICGLFLDFYSLHNILGISILILLLACIFSQFLNKRFFKKENKISLIIIFLISSLFYESLLIIMLTVLGMGFNFTFWGLVIKLIYNSVLALPIFYLIKWYVDKVKQIQS
jgi:rod shape-determining protein MreD